jgi:acid stress-induced BolA-like protein IbaG/YrbA
MNDDGPLDSRTISDEMMDHIRQRAVHAIRKKGYSPSHYTQLIKHEPPAHI